MPAKGAGRRLHATTPRPRVTPGRCGQSGLTPACGTAATAPTTVRRKGFATRAVGQATTRDDEGVIARMDLDFGQSYKAAWFDVARHRQPEQYRLIVEQAGVVPPE